uniref:Uncharacterized protein n=1 Tax=viral metagenome TaxID=1070528 RepID=A0A6C0J9T7_9ZZZZ
MKCLNEKKINKCEEFCDTSTGQCYKSTSKGAPWGFDKKNTHNDLIYNEEYRLFGKKHDVDIHINEINSALLNASLVKKNVFKLDVQNDISIDRFVSKDLHKLYIFLNNLKL